MHALRNTQSPINSLTAIEHMTAHTASGITGSIKRTSDMMHKVTEGQMYERTTASFGSGTAPL